MKICNAIAVIQNICYFCKKDITMPIIRFYSVCSEDVLSISQEFQPALAVAFDTSADNITLEVINSTIINNAQIEDKPYPMVEILSFQREIAIEQRVAELISLQLKKVGYPNCDTYFIYLSKSGYYVNGETIF